MSAEEAPLSIPERKLSAKGRNTFPRQATRRPPMDMFRYDIPACLPPPKVKKCWALASEENPGGIKDAVYNPSDIAWLDDNHFVVSIRYLIKIEWALKSFG